jgi:hypothetical protein
MYLMLHYFMHYLHKLKSYKYDLTLNIIHIFIIALFYYCILNLFYKIKDGNNIT